MSLLAWIVLGALLGAVAGVVMGPSRRVSRAMNLLVGIAGAVLAGWLLSPLIGLPALNEGRFSIGALVVAAVGAVLLLVVVNAVRRGDTPTPKTAAPPDDKETDDGTQSADRHPPRA
jgi:uncharacterized membrane protein YeaQ/YmgE (transglycosylase-associated protein family)